jgi:hypothetical protein
MTERNEKLVNFYKFLTLRRNRKCRLNRLCRFDFNRFNHFRKISQNQDKLFQNRDDDEKSIKMQRQEILEERDQREKRVKNSKRFISFVRIKNVKRFIDQVLNHHFR